MPSYALSGVSQYVAVATASAAFTNPMKPGVIHHFTSSTACWVRVTATGTAAVAATEHNIYCPADGVLLLVSPDTDKAQPSSTTTTNGFVKVIRASADGVATLTPLVAVG